LNVSFVGVRAEVLLHLLEEKDIYVSTGSACSSRHISTKGSHVLNAIGLSEKEITGAIRFSFSSFNTIEEVDYVIEVLKNSLTFLRRVKI
jgi:cysteine desulfurase